MEKVVDFEKDFSSDFKMAHCGGFAVFALLSLNEIEDELGDFWSRHKDRLWW